MAKRDTAHCAMFRSGGRAGTPVFRSGGAPTNYHIPKNKLSLTKNLVLKQAQHGSPGVGQCTSLHERMTAEHLQRAPGSRCLYRGAPARVIRGRSGGAGQGWPPRGANGGASEGGWTRTMQCDLVGGEAWKAVSRLPSTTALRASCGAKERARAGGADLTRQIPLSGRFE